MSPDSTYQIVIWSIMETGLTVIAGSLITIRPLMRWLFSERSSSSNHQRTVRVGHSGGGYALSVMKRPGSDSRRYWRHGDGQDENTGVVVISTESLVGNNV
jgi:hypothetical protein